MPIFTIETTYLVPVFRQRTIRASDIEQACRLALADDDWGGETPDYENAGTAYVSGIWRGRDAAYRGETVPIPTGFEDAIQRKLELLATFLALLKEPARPRGLSRSEFEHWLPRALAAIAETEAFIETDSSCGSR